MGITQARKGFPLDKLAFWRQFGVPRKPYKKDMTSRPIYGDNFNWNRKFYPRLEKLYHDCRGNMTDFIRRAMRLFLRITTLDPLSNGVFLEELSMILTRKGCFIGDNSTQLAMLGVPQFGAKFSSEQMKNMLSRVMTQIMLEGMGAHTPKQEQANKALHYMDIYGGYKVELDKILPKNHPNSLIRLIRKHAEEIVKRNPNITNGECLDKLGGVFAKLYGEGKSREADQVYALFDGNTSYSSQVEPSSMKLQQAADAIKNTYEMTWNAESSTLPMIDYQAGLNDKTFQMATALATGGNVSDIAKQQPKQGGGTVA